MVDTIPKGVLISLAMWGGLGVNVSYANLKGASPFVDGRFGWMAKNGKLIGWISLTIGLMGTIVPILSFFWTGDWHQVENASIAMITCLVLIPMGSSMLYRLSKDQKDEA